ncbi:unnamed protein product [Prorocentrum cordatum]|uniref:Uncharacterized protein n=1 Tax=Prorocentrum cordatum TaxID=2364126 RepID=A0ABN9VCI3_9DINO|nr:unnamed protein product [Polarella glacialis]
MASLRAMATPALKLPIGARAPGVADPADVASVASPLRRRGAGPRQPPGKAAPQAPPPASSPTASPSSYREQLRASGLGALQGSRAGGRSAASQQASSPAGSLTFFPPPLSFAGPPAGAPRALPQFEPATPDASARSPPAALLPSALGAPAPPFVPVAEVGTAMPMQPMAPMVGFPPQACGWPDLSPIAAASPATATPMAFFDQMQMPPADFQCFGGVADLMAIAMPQAAGAALDPEQLAAQLRAAAPTVYED